MGNANGPARAAASNPAQQGGHRGARQTDDYAYATFSTRQRQALQRRYQTYDRHENQGIPLDVCLAMPEFAGNKLITILIHDYLDPNTGRLHLQDFIKFCLFLSPYTSPEEKKKALFESFNVYGTDTFTHDEIFRLYKVLLGHVVSDDHILALTFQTLRHPSLRKQGQITKDEFFKMIPDTEMEEKLTVCFNIPAS
ncbi:uncharacterized protein LOC101858753 [Aplysia californica]|uniref:Uncharacterized protein LOC101858753 n=1 Tax=Aplysia californica TaxID=6500 RepID=A0ABM0JAP8_APLCA|nr:uncharacterized protein LOC101858753 [Aplysia californica]